MRNIHSTEGASGSQAFPEGGFFSKLPQEPSDHLQLLMRPIFYSARSVLFSEGDFSSGVYLILDGEVKLFLKSDDGKRLTLQIAKRGSVLGLASIFSNQPSAMSAEALYPSMVAFLQRADLLDFLARYPAAFQLVAEELGSRYVRACGQLRTVGLSTSVPAKLARLLLDWSKNGRITEDGTQCCFPFSHEDISEFIGTSRETVTRTLTRFKNRRLVVFHGSQLTIPNRAALERAANAVRSARTVRVVERRTRGVGSSIEVRNYSPDDDQRTLPEEPAHNFSRALPAIGRAVSV